MHQLEGEFPKLTGTYKKKIMIGATEDEIVAVEIRIGDECGSPDTQRLSISGTTYNRRLMSDEEGQRMARDRLEDGDLWRGAVKAERTTLGLDEWVDEVISTDGWEAVIGDVQYVGNGMYVQENGGGQIDIHISPDSFEELAVSRSDLERIWRIWSEHHLELLTRIPLVFRIEATTLFDKYPSFEKSQLLRFGRHN